MKYIFLPKTCLLIFCFSFFSCYRVEDRIEPKINYQVEKIHINSLTSPFPPLSYTEKAYDWGKEYLIALKFAENFDLYRAISTFKRAEVLIEEDEYERALEISYFIVYCYFLGKKYVDAIIAFENSDLPHIDTTFITFHDLMIILFECYKEIGDEEKTGKIAKIIQKHYPESSGKIQLSVSMKTGDIAALEIASKKPENFYLTPLLNTFDEYKKSVGGAQALNALLPGSGYLYLGLYKSGVTALFLNSLFIGATYYFFNNGNIAAGIITTSFEMGWYFGGIYGAGEQAKFYNERVYESLSTPLMNEKRLFPIYLLQFGF